MANPNLTRIHQKIFSENAANNGQFGSLQTGTKVETPDISVLQALAAYQEGWSDAVISGEELPPLEEFNGLHKIETEQLQYLLNKGIPEWSADAEYYIGDIQREVGGRKLYRSITDNNIGNALTDTLNWEIYYDPDNSIFDNVTINNKLNLQPNTATISGGAVTFAGSYMVIDTEGGAATDDLTTINGGSDGDLVLITLNNSSRNVVIKHNVGNIFITEEEDILLDLQTDSVLLRYDGINANAWYVVSRSINSDISIAQVVNFQTGATASSASLIPYDDTIPQITEGAQYMSASITPKGANNVLRIDVVFNYGQSVNAAAETVALFKVGNSNALAAAATTFQVGGVVEQVSFTHFISAGDTSSQTFTVRAGGTAGTTQFNGEFGSGRRYGGVMSSSITITEITT